jgi:hypothetical protein
MKEYEIKQMIRDTIKTQNVSVNTSGSAVAVKTAQSGNVNILEISTMCLAQSNNDAVNFYIVDSSGNVLLNVWTAVSPGFLSSQTLETASTKRALDVLVPIVKLRMGQTLMAKAVLGYDNEVTVTSWNDQSL